MTRYKHKFVVALVVGSAMAATSAHAGFSVVKPSPLPPPSAVAGASPLSSSVGLIATRFIGEPAGPIATRYGFGRGVPLADALKQIAPAGWHARVKEGMLPSFDRQRKVDWRGGRPWTTVLDILANDQGFSVDVDWSRQMLLIGERLSAAVLAPVPAATPVPAVVAATKPVPLPDPVWRAATGSTLRATVADWAKQAGWTLRWEAAGIDYPIVAPLRFTGSYVTGVSAAISAYAHADRPLWVCLYTQQQLTRVTDTPCRTEGAP